MVAEPFRQSSNQSTQGLSTDQLQHLLSWMRILQQALTLEAENGFKNLEGRQENFHAFLVRQLAEHPLDGCLLKVRLVSAN